MFHITVNITATSEPKTCAALKGLELKISQYPLLLRFINNIDPEHEDITMINELVGEKFIKLGTILLTIGMIMAIKMYKG